MSPSRPRCLVRCRGAPRRSGAARPPRRPLRARPSRSSPSTRSSRPRATSTRRSRSSRAARASTSCAPTARPSRSSRSSTSRRARRRSSFDLPEGPVPAIERLEPLADGKGVVVIAREGTPEAPVARRATLIDGAGKAGAKVGPDARLRPPERPARPAAWRSIARLGSHEIDVTYTITPYKLDTLAPVGKPRVVQGRRRRAQDAAVPRARLHRRLRARRRRAAARLRQEGRRARAAAHGDARHAHGQDRARRPRSPTSWPGPRPASCGRATRAAPCSPSSTRTTRASMSWTPWARSNRSSWPCRSRLYDPKSLTDQEGPEAGALYFGVAVDPVNPDAVKRQKADLPMLDVYGAKAPNGLARAARAASSCPRNVSWRAGYGKLVVLKRFKSFTRGAMSWTCTSSTRGDARGCWRSAALRSRLGAGCSECAGASSSRRPTSSTSAGATPRRSACSSEAEALVPEPARAVAQQGLHLPAAHRAGQQAIPQSRRAVACALAAFKRLGQLRPGDARADQLTDRDDVRRRRLAGARAICSSSATGTSPTTSTSCAGCSRSTTSRAGGQQSLEWCEAHRGAAPERRRGVLRRRHLHLAGPVGEGRRPRDGGLRPTPSPAARRRGRRGGPDPVGAKNVKGKVKPPAPVPVAPPAPVPGPDALSGPLRAELADDGIRYLEEAVRLRPRYAEAMTLPRAALAPEVVLVLRRRPEVAGGRRQVERVAEDAPTSRARGSPRPWRSSLFARKTRTARSRQRRVAFTLVAVFHGVLIAAGVVYSYWHVEELTPPTLRVTFMSAPPPPPPPPPPPAGGGARAKKVAVSRRRPSP